MLVPFRLVRSLDEADELDVDAVGQYDERVLGDAVSVLAPSSNGEASVRPGVDRCG